MTRQLNPATSTIDGVTYDARPQSGCDGCALLPFNSPKCSSNKAMCSTARPDATSVIWVEREAADEPDDNEVPIEDRLEWAEKGLAEWRELADARGKELARLQAVNRIAVRYLDKILVSSKSVGEQCQVEIEARDWLASIGDAP